MSSLIHDNTIYKYIVDYETKELTFFTHYEEERTKITFKNLFS